MALVWNVLYVLSKRTKGSDDDDIFHRPNSTQGSSSRSPTQESNCVLPLQLLIRLQTDGDVLVTDKVSFLLYPTIYVRLRYLYRKWFFELDHFCISARLALFTELTCFVCWRPGSGVGAQALRIPRWCWMLMFWRVSKERNLFLQRWCDYDIDVLIDICCNIMMSLFSIIEEGSRLTLDLNWVALTVIP